jgi:hypothetical protein
VSGETPTQTRIRECIDSFDHSIGWKDDCQSELARLRAVDEAWRAVRTVHESQDEDCFTAAEVELQIARLDQLKAPTPTGGK